jgi:hypothetical protein
MFRGMWRIPGLALVAILVGGCLDADRPEIRAANELDVPIDVTFVPASGTPQVLGTGVDPGLQMVSNQINKDECLDGKLVATDAAGTVLATFDGPVCEGATWHVTAAAPSPSAVGPGRTAGWALRA